jgi:FKBP-type peptidyl-prolyl cis-trans isomerase
MNLTLLLNTARKELEFAKIHAAHDTKTAQIAKQTAKAAKAKLKQARKLVKFSKKVARKAEDQAETAIEVLERAQTRLEKLQKRFRKNERKHPTAAKPEVKKRVPAKAPVSTATSNPVPFKVVKPITGPAVKAAVSTIPTAGKIVKPLPDAPAAKLK